VDAPDVRIVWQMDQSEGADAVVARARFPEASTLRGARVGYESTALGAYVVARFLAQSGLRPQDVVLVPLPLDEHLPAWRAGTVDAICTYEPTLSHLLREGAHTVWDSRSIPGELVDVLVVTRSTLEAQLPCVIDLVRRWDEVRTHWLQEPRALAPKLAPRLGLPPEHVPAAFRGLVLAGLDANEAAFFGNPPTLEQSLRKVRDVMIREALVPNAPDPATLLDPRVVLGRVAERP
jgi:NitT/TauT family transport system substrate-binding protein